MSDASLSDRVERDPKLNGREKETTMTMCGDEKRVTVFSAKPTVVKSLLDHDHFAVEWLRLLDDEGSERVSSRDAARERDGAVVAAEGTLPVGTLTVKSKPRANNHQSSVVNTETIDSSVFEE